MSNTNVRNLTVREAIAFYNGLPVLDGYVESVTVESTTVEDPKTGEKKTTVKRTAPKPTPYKFGVDGKGGGKVRFIAAWNLDIFGREQKAFEKARDATILEISGGTGTIDDSDKELIGKLNAALQPLLDHEIQVTGLRLIPLAELNLEGNPDLTPSALAPLMSLIAE